MKHLKKINYLILILIGFMIGIAIAAIVHNHDIKSPWWGHLIVVIGSIFITLTLHELTHAFVFSINNIKLKLYIYLCLCSLEKAKSLS